ncbi:hypothetical protein ABZ208_30695 [Streptomyces sp. NPDC006208]
MITDRSASMIRRLRALGSQILQALQTRLVEAVQPATDSLLAARDQH